MSRKKHPRQSWLINFHGKFLKKKSSIFNTYLEVRNQHARFLNTVVILVDIIVILIFLKAAYIVARNLGVIEKISEFEHIDILAIFFGALGIIMAFLITIYVEGNHDKEHRSLKSATKLIIDTTSDLTSKATEITSTTHDIFTQTNKILAKFNSLEQLKDLSERLSAFEEILTITEDSQKLDEKFHNELYILNYNASYGHLQSFNANITIKETQHKKGVNSWSEYHREIHKYYVDREIKNFFRLSTLKKETVHFALLRTNEHDRENHEDRYEKLLKKVLLEGKDHKVIAYSEFDTDPDNFILLDQLNEKSDRDVYTLELPEVNPKEYTPGGATDQKHLKGSLIKKLLEDNRNKLNSIKNQNIAFLDYIPFQFFLTAPKGPNLGSRQKCLIIFTNILSIEEHKTNTVSFTSDNAELIQSLKDIHVTLTNEYLINKAQSENLEKVFDCKKSKICFVMKKILSTDMHMSENSPLAYYPDYVAYTDLNGLFSDYNVVNTLVQFDSSIDIENPDQGKTYVLIGLFKNKVTDALKDLKNIFPFDKYFRCFYFSRNEENDKEEIIKLAEFKDKQPTVSKDENDWIVRERKEKEEDLVLFAKIEYKGANYIICGGLRSYGTRIIGKYIREKWDHIANDIIEKENISTKSFGIIFRIPKIKGKESEYEEIWDHISVLDKFFYDVKVS